MPTSPFTFECIKGISVYHVHGYLSEEPGDILLQAIIDGIEAGQSRFCFEFSDCPMINSLGLTRLFDMCVRIVDDHGGRLAFSHLNDHQAKFFELMGLPFFGPIVSSVEEAVALLQG